MVMGIGQPSSSESGERVEPRSRQTRSWCKQSKKGELDFPTTRNGSTICKVCVLTDIRVNMSSMRMMSHGRAELNFMHLMCGGSAFSRLLPDSDLQLLAQPVSTNFGH